MNNHGGDRHAASLRTGVPESAFMDFSASINPLGVSRRTRAVIGRSFSDLEHYPEPFAESLSARLEAFHELERGAVVCGNGSTELIYVVPALLKPRSVLIPAPTFSEYERACARRPKTRIIHFPLRADRDFAVDPDAFITEMKRNGCDMAFLCNPNNPTGQALAKADVMRIAAAARKLKCWLVVDEAFIDFCAENSVIDTVRTNPFLIVLRSMTKYYALPGLRLGYGVFHRTIADAVHSWKEPWTVNALALKAGIASLDDAAYRKATGKMLDAEKAFVEQALAEAGIGFVPSSANYYLIRIGNARRAAAELERRRILVRDCSNFRGMGRSHVRIAVRTRRENRVLMKELAALRVLEGRR